MSNKLICPNCGTEFALPERSEFAMGMTLARSGGNTTYEMPVSKVNNNNVKENKKMREFMSVEVGGKMAKFEVSEDGKMRFIEFVEDKKELSLENIPFAAETEYVFNSRTDGRWMMAQTMSMLDAKDWRGREIGWTGALNRKGYMYSWKVASEAIHTLAKAMSKYNHEFFAERARFINAETISFMLDDYMVKLKEYCEETLPRKKGNGLEYIKFPNAAVPKYNTMIPKIDGRRMIYVNRLHRLYEKMNRGIWRVKRAITRRNYMEIDRELTNFLKYDMIALPYDTYMSKAFVDDYKGCGAYYTLRNMIRHHGLIIDGMTTKDSLCFLEKEVDAHKGEYYKLQGLLKDNI